MQNIIHSTFVQKTEKTLTQTQLFGFVRSREAWLRTEFSVRSREAWLQTDFLFFLGCKLYFPVRSREAWLRTEFSVRSREARLRTEF